MTEYIISTIITLLTSGGIGGIFYYTLNKRLKKAEVIASEYSNIATTNLEWQKLSDELQEERVNLLKKVEDRNRIIDELRDRDEAGWKRVYDLELELSKKDLIIQDLTYKKCTRNNCPYRKPPRELGEESLPENADFSFINGK